MKTVEIVQKEYLPEQQSLIDILNQHLLGEGDGLPIVFKAPRLNKQRTHINRIPCKTIGGKGDCHLISMKVIDFVRLMVKSGIEVKIYEAEAEAALKEADDGTA